MHDNWLKSSVGSQEERLRAMALVALSIKIYLKREQTAVDEAIGRVTHLIGAIDRVLSVKSEV
jgi:hypothetical protein